MEKYVCKHCGSEHIQIRAWVGANDNQVHEWCEDSAVNYHDCWCEDCNDITEWEMKEVED